MPARIGTVLIMAENTLRTADLRWLLLGIGLVMLLHVAHFSLWVTVFAVTLAIWRYLSQHYHWRPPGTLVLLPLTVLAALGILLTHRGLFGRDASVELLALMLMLKLMEAKSSRDLTVLVFGALFLSITAFLFTQSMLYAAGILASTFALTATLTGISHPNGSLDWRKQSRIAGKLLLQGLPLMLALFFLFPRVPGPLWSIPQASGQALSGLSDTMEPGTISDLTLSGEIAFRVEFEGTPPPASQRYWRGPVLWHYDGRSWTMASQRLFLPYESVRSDQPVTKYTVTMEPSNRRSLLLLDMPAELPPESSMTRDMQVLSNQPVRARIRFDAASWLDYRLAADVHPRVLELNLQIPDIDNPKSRALAQSWRDAGKTPQAIIETALRMFREQAFVYTLQPPLLGEQAMDDFLFNTRRGFCEHYASSFVFLMRAAGVPARVVTGYQGGELNPVGNYLIVRQSDAHAWAEVWLDEKGWVRVDPTSAVSPSRIESGIADAVSERNLLPLLARTDSAWLKNAFLNLDALDNAWNHWVLEYDQKRQLELFSDMSGRKLSWQDLVSGMMLVVAATGLLLSYFILRGKPAKRDLLQRSYGRFLRKMKRRGITRLAHEGPLDFGRRAASALPHKAGEIGRITEIYNRLRYGGKDDAGYINALEQLVKSIR